MIFRHVEAVVCSAPFDQSVPLSLQADFELVIVILSPLEHRLDHHDPMLLKIADLITKHVDKITAKQEMEPKWGWPSRC